MQYAGSYRLPFLSMLAVYVRSRFCHIGWLGMACLVLMGTMAAQGWTDWQGNPGTPRLRARLIDIEINAGKRAASVEVEAQNVWLHSPVAPVSQYGVKSAVLEYKLDNDPSVVTPDTRLKFEQLTPGNHVIAIRLIGIDDQPIDGVVKLSVHVP